VVTALLAISAQVFVYFYSPFTGLIMMGLSFGLVYATAWSGVLNVVHEHHYGKAFSYIIGLQ
jgi:hypothetical protein